MSLSDASVLCALAQSQGVLVGARFAQGGGALTSAAACEPAFAEVAWPPHAGSPAAASDTDRVR